MLNFLDKYYQLIGILLVLAILTGGGGIIYKQNLKLKTKNEKPQLKTENLETGQQPQTPQQKPSKININTASQEELESLPGIGEVKAKAIIDFREKEGKFKSKRDIIKVKGIGEKTYEKIKNLIEVN